MDKWEVLLQLLRETPEVLAEFRRWWHEYCMYRRSRLSDEALEVLELSREIVFSQFEILEVRIHNILRLAEQVKSEGDR